MGAATQTDLRRRIEALPGMERLLPALEGLVPAHLVGGAVRDLLRGAEAVDLDVAVEGDALSTARVVADRLRGEVTEHARFGTATVRAGDLHLDMAGTRSETYERPGALPTVAPAGLTEDLARRDFTVNAMAAGLTAGDLGRLRDPHGGEAHLRAGVIAVLHPRSFIDDPTRLLRAVRYEVRLGFAMDEETERLARAASAAGAMATVSGGRIRDELLDLLADREVGRGVARMGRLGLDRALHPALDGDPELVQRAAGVVEETGAEPRLAALAALVHGDPGPLSAWLDDLHLRREQREVVARSAHSGPRIAAALREPLTPSALWGILHGEPAEALALALALGARAEPVRRWLGELCHVRLEITGEDLIDRGVAESPFIGRALAETLRRKLDGELHGRAQELEVALELAGEGG